MSDHQETAINDRVVILAPHHMAGSHGVVTGRLGTQVGGPAPLVRVSLDSGPSTSVAESMVEHENGSTGDG